jgi:hypothetical protein
MAKKQTSTTKKPTSAKKARTSAKKNTAVKKSTVKTTSAKALQALSANAVPNAVTNVSNQRDIELIPPAVATEILQQVNVLHAEWDNFTSNNLTLLQRRRQTGPGNSNYGFVDKVSDIALVNPEYAHFISIADLKNAIRNVEECRDIFAALQAFSRSVSNAMLTYSTAAFTIAREYYNQVKLRANQGDPTAIELYRILENRFKRPRKTPRQETNKQIERDVHDILTHKKDGEVVVRGSTPKVVRGKTEVIDDVRKGRAEIKGEFDDEVEN